MTTDLDRAIRSSLADIIATTPEPDDQPVSLVAVDSETGRHRPYFAVAAALVLLAGVGALIALGGTIDADPSPAAAPTATDDSTAPTTTVSSDSAPTAPSTVPDTPPSCPTAEVLVPNVVGMRWVDADAVLRSAGLEPDPGPEIPGPKLEDEPLNPDFYVIVGQATAPGTSTACGTIVAITVGYQPPVQTETRTYVIEVGDLPSTVAEKFGVEAEDIVALNDMRLTYNLDGSLVTDNGGPFVDGRDWVIGQTILIPPASEQ